MKKLLTIGILFLSAFMVGCANTQTTEYYNAVQNAAIAQANIMTARYEALGKIAGNGGEASTAAVMALAMTNQAPIIPQAQKSEALQWAQILAGPVASLGSMWLSNDATKTMARYSRDTQLENIRADQANTEQLYGMLGTNSTNMTNLGLGGLGAVTNVSNNAFDAMNTAGAQTVQLGLAGLTSNATEGFSASSADILSAINNISFPTYTDNFTSLENLITNQFTNTNTLIGDGFDTTDKNFLYLTNGINSGNEIWIPGVNCVNQDHPSIIGFGTVVTCPQ
tara:strand:+ start:831 stop:1673 length:843 start_codon:yes stop_codon:yes gene_type:complete